MFFKWVGMLRVTLIFLALLFLVAVSKAQVADDQRRIPEARKAAVNPQPSARDFSKINSQHKLLMAVVDTGVDYNHPLLIDHIHFNLNKSGQPIGTGFDFSAGDVWPSPYIAITIDQNSSAPAARRQEGALLVRRLEELRKAQPQFAQFWDPARNIIQEISQSSFHGTHVAALMVYDSPELGLLPYRAYPYPMTFRGDQPTVDLSQDALMKSVEQAVADGARVINLSLGVTRNRAVEGPEKKAYEEQKKRMAALQAFAARNPQVAFIAASGNEGAWIDDRSRLNLPCGVNAPNILCVGALDVDGGLAAFSNVVLPDYPFLLAPGENILSAFPSQLCSHSPYLLPLLAQGDNSFPWSTPRGRDHLVQSLTKECQDSNGMFISTGTSMATPIAARLVGKLMAQQPQLSGSAAIQQILRSGEDLRVGKLVLTKLKVEKPSWYQTLAPWSPGRFFNKTLTEESEYFELITR
ncbi:MAG: S8 family peptidase [Pseudobdellovibrionaceae bacterium]